MTCSGVKTADGGGAGVIVEDGAAGVAVERGAASAVDPAADVVGAVRGGTGSIGAVRDGAVVIGAVEPLESAGGGGGSESWCNVKAAKESTCTRVGQAER